MNFQAKRLAGDIRVFTKSKMIGKEYDVWFNSEDISKSKMVIYGSEDSCYKDCILYFDVECSSEYPTKPPQFKFITPINQRFHPNLYATGKVCLTILNTWHDSKVEGWSMSFTLESILITIRSLLHNNPLSEEPGQQCSEKTEKAKNYYIGAKYYALDNTFSYFLSDINIPTELLDKMKKYFKDHVESYEKTIQELELYNGKIICYFHGQVIISVEHLKSRLQQVIDKIN